MNVALTQLRRRYSVVESWEGYFANLSSELAADRTAAAPPAAARVRLRRSARTRCRGLGRGRAVGRRAARGRRRRAAARVYPGGHTFTPLERHLAQMLSFAGRALRRLTASSITAAWSKASSGRCLEREPARFGSRRRRHGRVELAIVSASGRRSTRRPARVAPGRVVDAEQLELAGLRRPVSSASSRAAASRDALAVLDEAAGQRPGADERVARRVGSAGRCAGLPGEDDDVDRQRAAAHARP